MVVSCWSVRSLVFSSQAFLSTYQVNVHTWSQDSFLSRLISTLALLAIIKGGIHLCCYLFVPSCARNQCRGTDAVFLTSSEYCDTSACPALMRRRRPLSMSVSFEEGWKISDLKVVHTYSYLTQIMGKCTHTRYERVPLSLNFRPVARIALERDKLWPKSSTSAWTSTFMRNYGHPACSFNIALVMTNLVYHFCCLSFEL